MTTPAPPQAPPPVQQPDGDALDDTALALAIAALLSGATAAVAAAGVAAMIAALKLRFALSSAAWQALGAVLSMVTEEPHPVAGGGGQASAQASRMNAARRAQYVVAATKRVLGAARDARAKGLPTVAAVRDALATERRYYQLHLAAMANRADAAAETDTAAAKYGKLLGWKSVLDSRTSAECRAAHGKNYLASRMPDIGFPGSVHPNCFPAGTTVASPSLRAAAARWYRGELIELTTFRGHHLAVTPNHPVLTSQGWVAAGLLREGTDVVSTRFGEALLDLVDPHDYQQPALIEDVLGAFSEHPGVLPCAVPVAAEDFHGDGGSRDGEVAVVWAHRMLVDDLVPAQAQPGGVQEFGRQRGRGAVPLFGPLAPLLPRHDSASHGVMSRPGVARVLLGRALGHHEPVGVSVTAARNPVALQDAPDDEAGAVVHLRQLVLAGALGIGSADEVLGKVARSQARALPALHGEVIGGPLVAERTAFGEALDQEPLGNVQVVGDLLVPQVAGLIEFDRLVKVHRRAAWSGHVFNLESSAGWLITDNIITHNCRCEPGPPWPGGKLLPGSAPGFARAA